MNVIPYSEKKIPTSVSFDQDLLAEIDRVVAQYDSYQGSRSRFINLACWELVERFLAAEQKELSKAAKGKVSPPSGQTKKPTVEGGNPQKTLTAKALKPIPKMKKTPTVFVSNASAQSSVAPAKRHVKPR